MPGTIKRTPRRGGLTKTPEKATGLDITILVIIILNVPLYVFFIYYGVLLFHFSLTCFRKALILIWMLYKFQDSIAGCHQQSFTVPKLQAGFLVVR